ncbi:MAG TPA: hypothetical protein VJO34_00900 [Methylomirabilota bacterium]|nr:hypothetical protein [Methylomirabilota bacterium]
MDHLIISERMDQALSANRRAELIIVRLAGAIFALSVVSLVFAFWTKSLFLGLAALLLGGLLYWPFVEIRKLRRENLCLEAIPALAYNYSPERGMEEIGKLLEMVRTGKDDPSR